MKRGDMSSTLDRMMFHHIRTVRTARADTEPTTDPRRLQPEDPCRTLSRRRVFAHSTELAR